MSELMITISNLLWVAALLAVLIVWRVVGAVRRRHRHHRSANRRFMAGYHAGYRAARAHSRSINQGSSRA